MSETYNPAGHNGRDCPRCFRVGTLTGARVDDGILECSGCAARFRLQRSEFVDTLVRLREPRLMRPGTAAVLLAGLFVLAFLTLMGCSTPDVMCDMRADYESTRPPKSGRVALAWRFDQGFVQGRRYGETWCDQNGNERACVVLLQESPPDFNNVCGLARLGHEVVHAMGASHPE